MKKCSAALAIFFFLIFTTCALAQNDAAPDGPRVVMYSQQMGPEGVPPGPPPFAATGVPMPPPPDGSTGIVYFSAGLVGDMKPVAGSPYSATAQTETTQVLSDGNRIAQKTTSFIARDSLGRTRREQKMGALGPWKVNGPDLIFISDPVAQTDYVLNSQNQTARVMKRGAFPPPPPPGGGVGGGVAGGVNMAGGNFTFKRGPAPDQAQLKKDSLGTQVIAGVTAEGTRETRTIPAGQIGNERPIEIVSETWYSPDLHVLVQSKRSDPRIGDTLYQLTNIQRQEPDPSLFQVPPNYTIQGPPNP